MFAQYEQNWAYGKLECCHTLKLSVRQYDITPLRLGDDITIKLVITFF